MGVALFDLDGTLADIEHRRHLVRDGGHRWDEFYRECVNDVPNLAVVHLARMVESYGHDIVILSGRSDVVREETKAWLRDNGVPYTNLLMRPAGDSTPDQVLKREWLWTWVLHRYAKHEIIFVVDDRQKVVDMWRAEGLTCLQCAPGDF